MARYKTCIFCDKNDSPPSEEDILARWIAREWPKGHFTIAKGFTGEELIKMRRARSGPGKHSSFGFVTSRPCERCNSGWMSRLENAVKPLLTDLIWARNISIASDQQLLLARWLMKTAMAWEFYHERVAPRFFRASDRFDFHLPPHLVPPQTIMSIARYAGGDAALILEPSNGVPLLLANGPAIKGHGYLVTFTIGQVALQVFSYRWAKDHHRQVHLTVPASWPTAVCNIWPQRLATIAWPPPEALDRQATADFAKRFLPRRK